LSRLVDGLRGGGTGGFWRVVFAGAIASKRDRGTLLRDPRWSLWSG
jgi:hypothetical protein